MRTGLHEDRGTHRVEVLTDSNNAFFLPVPIWTGAALDGIRAACRLSREILDRGHAVVQPGIMTDAIDDAVSA